MIALGFQELELKAQLPRMMDHEAQTNNVKPFLPVVRSFFEEIFPEPQSATAVPAEPVALHTYN
jgi:hypothetical protein